MPEHTPLQQHSSYAKCLQRLYALRGGGGRELDRLRDADKFLGMPSQAFASVHVAGTNGKGSVCTMIAKACEAAGAKTGLYTSPHISCFRERISINGKLIPENTFTRLINGVFDLNEERALSLSFFDITTLLAFRYFADEKVDIAIIETGVGGRLDATNIIMPVVSVITSISYDHTEMLGASIEAIAREKAGIIKPGIPVVIGPRVPEEIVGPIAEAIHSPMYVAEPTKGSFIEEDKAIAATAMEVLKVPLPARPIGLAASPPCRFEQHTVNGVTVILDVAHNHDGLTSLFQAISRKFPGSRLRLVLGLSKSKKSQDCLSVINDYGFHFYPVESSNGMNVPAAELLADLQPATLLPDVPSALRRALADAAPANDIVVVCGTFYIMGQARIALDIEEPRDPPIEY